MPDSLKLYRSRYGATTKLTFQQYVSETICARQARYRGVVLGSRFWLRGEWKRTFALQAMYCNSLLARFSKDVISAVLRSPQGASICTLRNPALVPLLEAEAARVKNRLAAAEARKAESPRDEHPAHNPTLPAGRPAPTRTGNLFERL